MATYDEGPANTRATAPRIVTSKESFETTWNSCLNLDELAMADADEKERQKQEKLAAARKRVRIPSLATLSGSIKVYVG